MICICSASYPMNLYETDIVTYPQAPGRVLPHTYLWKKEESHHIKSLVGAVELPQLYPPSSDWQCLSLSSASFPSL